MHFPGQTGAKLVQSYPRCTLHRLCNWYEEIKYDFELGMYYIVQSIPQSELITLKKNKDEIVWAFLTLNIVKLSFVLRKMLIMDWGQKIML